MYIDGAYWAWSPAIRSSARGSVVEVRSRSICRASRARFSSRWDSVRSVRGPAGTARSVGRRVRRLLPAEHDGALSGVAYVPSDKRVDEGGNVMVTGMVVFALMVGNLSALAI